MRSKDYLEKLAKESGYKNVNDFVVACEMLCTSRKVGDAIDSAFLPSDLDKYLADVDLQIYNQEFNK